MSLEAAAAFAADCERLARRVPAVVVAVDAPSGCLRGLVAPARARVATPAGSVFKLVTGLAWLEAGLEGPPVPCRGAWREPGAGATAPVHRCWRPDGHGGLELEDALARSCNVHFLALGHRLGAGRLGQAARACGLGPALGLEPARPVHAIGEGRGWWLTPLQGAGLVAAIASGGPVRTPGWGGATVVAARPARPGTLARLRAGMRRAVLGGTARQAAVPGLEVSGKTGTAGRLDGSGRTWGWFLGFARPLGARRPLLALAVRLEDASGGAGAAPLARQVLQAWLARGCP
ncbi:MAG: penicillin-binding transpeptidase domain-containing protein [Candidatus Sericytochromatia bacterium]|nr:penicillin-binding transpeptidase domain-containing protein [Candidatus Sericytochromatia bacterium]